MQVLSGPGSSILLKPGASARHMKKTGVKKKIVGDKKRFFGVRKVSIIIPEQNESKPFAISAGMNKGDISCAPLR